MTTYVDGFARTFESGPSDPVQLADGPGTVGEVDIDAQPSEVWPHVTDIDFPARYSEEFQGARWEDDSGPREGAVFIGRNTHPAIGEWEVPCFVDAFEAGTGSDRRSKERGAVSTSARASLTTPALGSAGALVRRS